MTLPTNCLKCEFCKRECNRMYVDYSCGKTGKGIELDNPGHSKPKKWCPLLKVEVQKQHEIENAVS